MPESSVTSASAHRAEHARRIHRVLEHIDRHLDESLDLAALARVAHFSSFHFHRIFSAWMGETLGDYLWRRRLEIGAQRLAAQPDTSVLEIALAVGFGSPEAFSRAFKVRFGVTPTAFRKYRRRRPTGASGEKVKSSNLDQVEGKLDPDFAVGARDHGVVGTTTVENPMKTQTATPLQVRTVERKPVEVVYLRHVGPYGEPISRFWQDVVYPWMVTNDLMGQPRYGVAHDDPSITSDENCRYDACVEVPRDYVVRKTMLNTTLAGGRYAVSQFKGTVAEIASTWSTLLREWLPESGLELDSRPFLEHYPSDSTYDPATEVFTCELCIPVAES